MSEQAMTHAARSQVAQTKPTSGLLQRTAITPIVHGVLQRCSNGVECPECRERRLQQGGTLQRAAVNVASTPAVPPIVHDVLTSSGHTLDASTRAFMEPRFGHDFSSVKVHTDARAAESARAVNALAYTVGNNVVFGSGQYQPETMTGKRLLAHELTHVVQQGMNSWEAPVRIDSPSSSYEREASNIAAHLEQSPFALPDNRIAPSYQGILQRAEDTDEAVDAGMPADSGIIHDAGSPPSAGVPDEPNVSQTPSDAEHAETEEAQQDFTLQPTHLDFDLRSLRSGKRKKEKQLKLSPESFCDKRILSEGTCQYLALHSKWICCDPANGFKRSGRKQSVAEPGKQCSSEKWTPHFTCDKKCKTSLEKGCSDDDHWMALPPQEFKLSGCDTQYTICANGRKTWGYVRDRSSSERSYEVSPGIQKALTVDVGDTFRGAVYRSDADPRLIDLNPCCHWPPLSSSIDTKLELEMPSLRTNPVLQRQAKGTQATNVPTTRPSPTSPYTSLAVALLATLQRSFNERIQGLPNTEHNLDNSFWGGPPTDLWAALDRFAPADINSLAEVYERAGGAWSYISAIQNVWTGSSRGFMFLCKDPVGFAKYLDSVPNFCRDSETGQSMHQSPNAKDCWRETVTGGFGLHICLDRKRNVAGNEIHIDLHQTVKGKDEDGSCDYSKNIFGALGRHWIDVLVDYNKSIFERFHDLQDAQRVLSKMYKEKNNGKSEPRLDEAERRLKALGPYMRQQAGKGEQGERQVEREKQQELDDINNLIENMKAQMIPPPIFAPPIPVFF